MRKREQIIQEIEQRLDLADYLLDKMRRYRAWKAFVLRDIAALKKRLHHESN